MVKIKVNDSRAVVLESEKLTSGRIGLQCQFIFSEDWDDLVKTAVCIAGEVTKDVLFTGDTITIPHECLANPFKELAIGVYGIDNSNNAIAIPTIYAMVGMIYQGADPSGDPSTDPTLPVYEQIRLEIGDLADLETTAKDTLVDAINEAAQSGGGGGTSNHNALSNRDSENQHPISAITGLQMALDGKQDTISDLDTIRHGAELGSTALQTAPVSSVNGKTGAVNLVPSDLGFGSVFDLKGSKPTYEDLPSAGNTVGDVWYVADESVGYIWLNDGTNNRWEKLGMSVDLSAYRTSEAQDAIDRLKMPKIAGGSAFGGKIVESLSNGTVQETSYSISSSQSDMAAGSSGKIPNCGAVKAYVDSVVNGLRTLLGSGVYEDA